MNQQSLHKTNVLCWCDINFGMASLVRMYRNICRPYHFVCDDVVQWNMVLCHDRQYVLNAAGNLVVSQRLFKCVSLKLNAYSEIIAMLSAV